MVPWMQKITKYRVEATKHRYKMVESTAAKRRCLSCPYKNKYHAEDYHLQSTISIGRCQKPTCVRWIV